MNSYFFAARSMTQAVTARNYLESVNIRSKIEKSSAKNGGCAYGVRVYGDAERAKRLLSAIGMGGLKS